MLGKTSTRQLFGSAHQDCFLGNTIAHYDAYALLARPHLIIMWAYARSHGLAHQRTDNIAKFHVLTIHSLVKLCEQIMKA
mgnify:FL=1